MKRQVLFSMALVSALTASAQRIDFNLTGRSESQVNEPEYTAWAVNTCETESKEVEDADGNPITITLANNASYAGRRLKSCWFKNGLSSSKLIADGFAIYGYEDGNTPQITEGAVRLNITLKGLSVGKHSLMAYHNNNDGFNAPKLDVYVNGTKQQEGIAQTNRAMTPSACGMSYVTFVAEEGKDVVVSYVTTPSASDDKAAIIPPRSPSTPSSSIVRIHRQQPQILIRRTEIIMPMPITDRSLSPGLRQKKPSSTIY